MLALMIDNLDGMVFRFCGDAHRSCLFASEGCRRLTGYGPGALIGGTATSFAALTLPQDLERVRRSVAEALVSGERYHVEYRIVCRDGTQKWVHERGVGLSDEFGQPVVEGLIEDITEQVLARHRLAEAEARYRGLFENAVVGIFQSTPDGHYLAANATLAKMYGYDSVEALFGDLDDIGNRLYVRPGRREEFKQQIREHGFVSGFESEVYRRDGSTLWITETAHAVHGADGEVLCYQGTVEDITERVHYRERIEYQANHDMLTGLPNRNLLRDRLEQAKAHAAREGGRVAVAFVDLDNFKVINDSLGHAIGDRLLVAIAGRIRACLRSVDTVARYGGDEFVLIMLHHGERDALEPVLERVLHEVARPVHLDGHELQVTCSIGVAVLRGDQDNAEGLLQQADAAMYSAKAAGRSGFAFYTPALNAAATERLRLEGALRRALERGEIDVHFQPKVDGSGRTLGFEALARWTSAEFGVVAPAVFIPIAEETGLIEPITEHVLHTACTEAVGWARMGLPAFGVAVNLSPRLFRSDRLVEQIGQALRRCGLPAQCLELELTEGSLMESGVGTVTQLRALRALGVRLAVDDFGTGYSSLAYLARFPFDILKIDKSFVAGAGEASDEAILVRAIASLGHELGLTVVAEGVETDAQWALMKALGCDEYQGYLFSRPLAAHAVPAWFRDTGRLLVDRVAPAGPAPQSGRARQPERRAGASPGSSVLLRSETSAGRVVEVS